jgi:hypothetical protein
MPDITMCLNQSCKSKEKCYRFIATATPIRQAYTYFGVVDNEKCEHFCKVQYRDEIVADMSSEELAEYEFIENFLLRRNNGT